MNGQLLQVATERNGSGVVVRAAGEVDMNTVEMFREALDRACEEAMPSAPVMADLSEVTFLASAGLTVLLDIHHRCRDQGTPLSVQVANRTVTRALEITGVDRILDLRPRT